MLELPIASPTDTLSVGSKVFVNQTTANTLTVLGNTYIQNSLVVDGDATFNGLVTTLHSNNTVIKDAILELGKDNVVGDSLLDLGLIMTRPNPDANVAIGFREVSNEFANCVYKFKRRWSYDYPSYESRYERPCVRSNFYGIKCWYYKHESHTHFRCGFKPLS